MDDYPTEAEAREEEEERYRQDPCLEQYEERMMRADVEKDEVLYDPRSTADQHRQAEDNYARAITELRDEKDRCDADPTHEWKTNAEQEGGKRKRRGHPAGPRKRKTRGRRGGRRKTRRKRGGMTADEAEAALDNQIPVRHPVGEGADAYITKIDDGAVTITIPDGIEEGIDYTDIVRINDLSYAPNDQRGGKLRGHPAGPRKRKTRRKRGGMTVPEAEAALVNQIPVRYSEYPDYDAYIRGIADGAATIRIYDGVGAYGHFTDTVEINDLTLEEGEVQEGGKRRRRPAGPRKTRRKRGGTKSPQQIKKEAIAREREFRKEANDAIKHFLDDYRKQKFPKPPQYNIATKVTQRHAPIGGKRKRKTRRKRH